MLMRIQFGLLGLFLAASCGCAGKVEETKVASVATTRNKEQSADSLPAVQRPAVEKPSREARPEEAYVAPHPIDYGKALELLNNCPSPEGFNHDPVALILAVNYLHSGGKERAIEALRRFLAAAPVSEPSLYERTDRRAADQQCLSLVIPLLFEPMKPGEEPPSHIAGAASAFFITLQDDIPFHNTRISGTSGGRHSTDYLVEWAKAHGKLRRRPLHPADNPLLAAERFLANKRWKTGHDESLVALASANLREHIRWQAWRMVVQLVEPGKPYPPKINSEPFGADWWWDDAKREVAEKKIYWDQRQQKYVSDLGEYRPGLQATPPTGRRTRPASRRVIRQGERWPGSRRAKPQANDAIRPGVNRSPSGRSAPSMPSNHQPAFVVAPFLPALDRPSRGDSLVPSIAAIQNH